MKQLLNCPENEERCEGEAIATHSQLSEPIYVTKRKQKLQ